MAFAFDHANHLIHVSAPDTVTLAIQDLANAISQHEASENGRVYDPIADMNGKFDKGLGFFSGIDLLLYDPWQVKFPSGTQVVIYGGSLLGGLGGQPIVPDTDVHSNRLTPVDGLIAQIATGSGLSPEQDTKLTTVHGLLSSIENGMDHQQVMRILLAAMAGLVSGADGTEIRFRDQANTKDRIAATVDEDGNRSAVTLDVS